MKNIVRIPWERVPALIGRDGKTKREIEASGKCALSVHDEDVEIEGEPGDVLTVMEVVKAIGRGFAPDTAMLLFDEDYALEIRSLEGESEKTVKRLMGRVIGRSGATRKVIEDTTGCHLAIYGKTVAVIGEREAVMRASQAVEDLLSGRSHGYVYRKLRG